MLPAVIASNSASAMSPLLKKGLIVALLVFAFIFGRREYLKYLEKKDEEKKNEEAKDIYDEANQTTESGAASAMARKIYSEINESTGLADDLKIIRLGYQIGDLKAVADAYAKISKGLILDQELNRVLSPEEVAEFYENVKFGNQGYSQDGRRYVGNGLFSHDYNTKLASYAITLLKPDDWIRGYIEPHKLISLGYRIFDADKFYSYFRSECKKRFEKEYNFLTEAKDAFGSFDGFDEMAKAIEANRSVIPL